MPAPERARRAPTMRASGFRPSAAAFDAFISTSAAAPSEMLDALAAVMVPSLMNAGFSVGILSSLAFGGCSSLPISVSPAFPFHRDRCHFPPERPAIAMAACARFSESMAYASCCSRVKPYFAAQLSANTPIALPRS